MNAEFTKTVHCGIVT